MLVPEQVGEDVRGPVQNDRIQNKGGCASAGSGVWFRCDPAPALHLRQIHHREVAVALAHQPLEVGSRTPFGLTTQSTLQASGI